MATVIGFHEFNSKLKIIYTDNYGRCLVVVVDVDFVVLVVALIQLFYQSPNK